MTLIFFILGLMFGSFINVVVHRLELAESLVFGGSRCPHCKKGIRWYDNVPALSFIVLKARCRDCKEKISWQYPIVEIVAGALFAFVEAKYFVLADAASWITSIYWLGIVCFLLAIALYDFLHLEIPGEILWPAIFWTIGFNLYFDGTRMDFANNIFNSSVFSGMLAAFLAFIFFFAISAGSKEKWMGIGDAYLALLCGAVVGINGILPAIVFSSLLGAGVGIFLVALGRKKMKSQIPFGPFLAAGTIIAAFCYPLIASWYAGLFF